jgi:pyridine nucleotide-disulfide oxidoreductase family protein
LVTKLRQLILLGGGHAHVQLLKDLAHQPLPGMAVTLVSPHARQLYSGMVPGVVAGHYSLEQASIHLAPLAQAAGVRLLEDAAAALDTNANAVTLHSGTRLGYDLISLDTGSVMHADTLPGAAQHALLVRPIETFVQGLDLLLARATQSALSVVVVGGGAAGVELALALQHRFSAAQPVSATARSSVVLLTGGGAPLFGYSAGVMRRAARVLAQRGVAVVPQACAQLTAHHAVLSGGALLPCDAAVLATGAQAPRWLQGSGLSLDERGFVQTGATLQSRSHANVFAVGDVASRVDVQHPRSGVYAVRAGPPLMANLRHWVDGSALVPHLPQRRTLNLLSCGERQAIVSWGRFSAQGAWAWRWKDHIDRAFVARYSVAAPS